MRADYLSYKSATSVSLLGLALQLALGVAALIYSVLARPVRDELGMTVAFFVLAGCVVWLVLAIVFDQHRRERIEAMELEAIDASGGRDSSVFAEGTDDLRVARKRLEWMHRFLVPAVSLAYAATLAGLGLWRFELARPLLKPEGFDKFQSSNAFGWPISIGLGLAFIGFVFARYTSGMAKQSIWANLKAGGSAAVGSALAGLALAVGHFVDYVGPPNLLIYMHIALPLLLVALAIEVVFNFVGGLYRPRVPGDVPRPAFDSRALGFVAAPDKIAESIGGALSYQFGFDVSGSWFYQLLSKSLTTLALTGVAVVWLLTCVSIVQPTEQGIRVRLGQRVSETPLPPGPYLTLPWPLEKIERIDTTTTRRVNLGGEAPKIQDKSILWTNEHGVTEYLFTVQPAAEDRSQAGQAQDAGLTPAPEVAQANPTQPGSPTATSSGKVRDFGLVAVELPLYYRIDDAVKFHWKLGPDEQREEMLRAIGRREAFHIMATYDVDAVLGEKRQELSAKIRQGIEKRLKELDAGVTVLFVGIEGVHPPRETAASFEALVQSAQKREGSLNTALDEANKALITVAGSVPTARQILAAIDELQSITAQGEQAQGKAGNTAQAQAQNLERAAAQRRKIQDLLSQAGGSAAAVIQNARGDRWARHMDARARSESYVGQLAGYRAAPEVFTAQRYFQTLEESLGKSRLYIVPATGVDVVTNLEDINTGGNLFNAPKPKE